MYINCAIQLLQVISGGRFMDNMGIPISNTLWIYFTDWSSFHAREEIFTSYLLDQNMYMHTKFKWFSQDCSLAPHKTKLLILHMSGATYSLKSNPHYRWLRNFSGHFYEHSELLLLAGSRWKRFCSAQPEFLNCSLTPMILHCLSASRSYHLLLSRM